MERVDIAIIGTGPAGVSAAITAKVRNKSVLLIGSRELSEKMSKAHQILNYPGLPEVSGADLVAGYKKQIILESRCPARFLRRPPSFWRQESSWGNRSREKTSC